MKTRFNPLAGAAPPPESKAKRPKSKDRKRPRRVSASAEEALSKAVSGTSVANYVPIFEGFKAKGIPEEDIKPRENVFTYKAWLALGRVVKRGEKGVPCTTWITVDKKAKVNPDSGQPEERVYSRPWHTRVFHISQTVPLNEADRADATQRAEEHPASGFGPEIVESRIQKPKVRSQNPEVNSVQTSTPIPVAFEPPQAPIPVTVAAAAEAPTQDSRPKTQDSAAALGWRRILANRQAA